MSEQPKPGCKRQCRGKGRDAGSAASAVSADGHLHGANGLILLRNRRPCLCPGIVTFTAGLCTVPTSMSMAYSRAWNRSMLIPPKFSLTT